MKKYIIRSVKYFFAMCLLCMALAALMLATGTSAMSLEDTVYVMFHTSRYALLLVALVVLAAAYPKFGFVKRVVEGDITENRAQIISAFRAAGFSLAAEQNGVLTFRADGMGHKIMMLFEDEIKVSQEGRSLVLDGIRRGVARVEYRLDSYIKMGNND